MRTREHVWVWEFEDQRTAARPWRTPSSEAIASRASATTTRNNRVNSSILAPDWPMCSTVRTLSFSKETREQSSEERFDDPGGIHVSQAPKWDNHAKKRQGPPKCVLSECTGELTRASLAPAWGEMLEDPRTPTRCVFRMLACAGTAACVEKWRGFQRGAKPVPAFKQPEPTKIGSEDRQRLKTIFLPQKVLQ